MDGIRELWRESEITHHYLNGIRVAHIKSATGGSISVMLDGSPVLRGTTELWSRTRDVGRSFFALAKTLRAATVAAKLQRAWASERLPERKVTLVFRRTADGKLEIQSALDDYTYNRALSDSQRQHLSAVASARLEGFADRILGDKTAARFIGNTLAQPGMIAAVSISSDLRENKIWNVSLAALRFPLPFPPVKG